MIYDYLVTLKKSNFRSVDNVSQLMYTLAILAFGYFYYHHQQSGFAYILFILAIVLSWIYSAYKKRKTGFAYYRLGLTIAAIGWFFGVERNIPMAVLYFVAAILEKQVKFPEEVGFGEDEIVFNTFPKKRLNWNELNNVLIKDGLLTIDQKNNKLFQKEIENGVPIDVELEFNSFCARCLQTVPNQPAA